MPEARPQQRRFRLGPGIITGIADDDPSGIATYSQGGAQFGYALSWTLLLTYPLMAAIQIASARIGRITGRGLVANFKRRYPTWMVATLVALLAVANVINLGADLRAMADVTALAIGWGHPSWYATFYGLGSLGLLVWIPYRRYVKILQWLSLSILAYVGVAFAVKVNWSMALSDLVWPRWVWHRDYLTSIVAILGTTISPYLFFWQSSQEVEEIQRLADREPLCTAPAQAQAGLGEIRRDTWVGMAISNGIAYFMIVAAAATLHAQGITHIDSTEQAAQALEPIAGPFAFWLFACGIVGTGLLALPVLASTVGYAVASLLDRPLGLDHRPQHAKFFYGTLAATMLMGLVLSLLPINPIGALYWSAVINAVIAVPIMAAVLKLASSAQAMNGFVLPPMLRILGWLATGAMGLACVAMVTQIRL
ncbi:MAG: NRAMP family divalent metal transporter [Acidobacteriota bacterium]